MFPMKHTQNVQEPVTWHQELQSGGILNSRNTFYSECGQTERLWSQLSCRSSKPDWTQPGLTPAVLVKERFTHHARSTSTYIFLHESAKGAHADQQPMTPR